jgi:hypothetical protein
MKTKLLITMMLAGIAAPLSAQTAAETKEPIDYEARAKSVITLKEAIAQRQARFDAVRKDLQTLDARLEERIDFLVKTLVGLKDSNNSKTKVANIKEDAITRLRRSITVYRQKRMEIFDRQRIEKIVPEAELAANIDTFDKRIGKRIEQIMELVKSLPGYQEVPKYERDGGTSYANGWYEENSRISEDWKQNRRQSNKTDTERRDLLKDLDKAIDSNDRRRSALAESLTRGKLSAKEQSLAQQELGRVDAALADLEQRRRELALPGDGGGREIGMSEASDIEQMIRDSSRDLQQDFQEIFRKYYELDKERTRIRGMEQNLAAREEWLKNNPPPAK